MSRSIRMGAHHLRALHEREFNAERLLEEARARELVKQLEDWVQHPAKDNEDRPDEGTPELVAWAVARATLTPAVGRAVARLKEARVERLMADHLMAGHLLDPDDPDGADGER